MMDRTSLINYLIEQRNFKQYLEIAAHGINHNFSAIRCKDKKSNFPINSDTFFSVNKESYDIIFIDGFHTEEQVLKDLEHAFACLQTNGVIILHDCMPPDAWHQREATEYKEGENWNGTVWKAALRIFNTSIYKCTLLSTDWGCGIIDTAVRQSPLIRKIPSELYYEVHYPWLLEYKQSVAEYLRDNVKVFYHLACMGNWEEAFCEQMTQLKHSGFNQVQLSVLGTKENLEISNSIINRSGIETVLHFYDPDWGYFEKPALMAIEKYARHYNGHVLYLHSKGVSNPADVSKIKWRRLMMRELVENWDECMMQLLRYDVIGVNWRDMPPISHFCGNFWYASTSYLRKLSDFNIYYDKPLYKIWDRINDKRLGCEFWIGSGRETPRVLSLFCRNIDFCNPAFWWDK